MWSIQLVNCCQETLTYENLNITLTKVSQLGA